MIHLYLKTHTNSSLQYFGKTEQDPYAYEGSGTLWKQLLSEHGKEHTTQVLYSSDNIQEIEAFAQEYSQKHRITENPNYVNLVHEGGGYTMAGECNPNYRHGRAAGWKSNKDIQKANDKSRNAEYHEKNKDKERARMKCRYYCERNNKAKAYEWYEVWKELSMKNGCEWNQNKFPDFDEYYNRNKPIVNVQNSLEAFW